eukprot:TRINITY_DN44572_c0_g1_i1.p1 TRINITY_DN44572_c0_g1~~TRINITY_DN44572_c0_g1_i1.p1  ORF type:complete len:255 (+),score=62.10 TRINITY_DN44572_c0_g1_i1:67-831(+)
MGMSSDDVRVDVSRDGGNLIAKLPMPSEAMKELDVDVDGRQLHITSGDFDVLTVLPCFVDGESAKAKYLTKTGMLVVTMPVTKEVDASCFAAGCEVEVFGLKSTELNGLRGTVKGPQGERVGVKLPPPHGSKALKPANLFIVESSGGLQAANPVEAEDVSVPAPASPPAFRHDDTVQISPDAGAVEQACRKSKTICWHAGKSRWCGKEAQVVSVDLRDNTTLVRMGQSVSWFPIDQVKLTGAREAEAGVTISGD